MSWRLSRAKVERELRATPVRESLGEGCDADAWCPRCLRYGRVDWARARLPAGCTWGMAAGRTRCTEPGCGVRAAHLVVHRGGVRVGVVRTFDLGSSSRGVPSAEP